MEINSYELFKEIRLGDKHLKLFFIPNLVIFLFFIDCGIWSLKNINIIMQIYGKAMVIQIQCIFFFM